MPPKSKKRKITVENTNPAKLFAKIAKGKPDPGEAIAGSSVADNFAAGNHLQLKDMNDKVADVPAPAEKSSAAGTTKIIESAEPGGSGSEGQLISITPLDVSDRGELAYTFKQESTEFDSTASSNVSLYSNHGSDQAATRAEESNRQESIENKMNDILQNQQKCLLLLAQANAKLDSLGSDSGRKQVTGEPQEPEKIFKIALNPVKTLAELEAVEERCKDEQFVDDVIRSIGTIHGRNRFKGNGGTVCHQIIDRFVDRRFFRYCSWTGISKTMDENQQLVRKIAFSKFEHYIDLFYTAVRNADEDFTKEQCHKFLKQCLRNSKQRLDETRNLRMPAARKRCKKILLDTEMIDDTQEDMIIDEKEEEEGATDNLSEVIIEEVVYAVPDVN
nr:uncharacterized protein LOC115259286 [Aedes albopictus]